MCESSQICFSVFRLKCTFMYMQMLVELALGFAMIYAFLNLLCCIDKEVLDFVENVDIFVSYA